MHLPTKINMWVYRLLILNAFNISHESMDMSDCMAFKDISYISIIIHCSSYTKNHTSNIEQPHL